MLRIEMLPAEEGDCFLINIDNKYHVMVDGGTAYTYKHFLKSRLQSLANRGKKIDLLIVSHIDNDHIGGIINFIKDNGCSKNPNIIPVGEIWHNSYRHFTLDRVEKIGFQEKEILDAMISNGNAEENIELSDKYEKDVSAIQGTTLAGLLYTFGYVWNKTSNNLPVKKGLRYNFNENVYLEVIAPNNESLENLKKHWKRQLIKNKIDFKFSKDCKFDDAFEYYMRFLKNMVKHEKDVNYNKEIQTIKAMAVQEYEKDLSITNNSSICFLIYYKGERLLFLGDISVTILENCNIFNKYALIKIPHHGSKKNYSNEFAKKTIAEKYLISTNGIKHNHPDIETIVKILYYNAGKEKHLYFNYNHQQIRNLLLKKESFNDNMIFYMPDKPEIITIDIGEML